MFLPLRLARRLIASSLSLVVLVGCVAAGLIVYNAYQDQRTHTDAIVVLGAAQFNGTPSPVFANRLDHAMDLILQDVAPVIITVGGKQPGDRYTEAGSGRAYLIDGGLTEKQVIAIPTGSDTLESLTAVAVLLHKNGWTSITVVSDPAHMARIKSISDALGFSTKTSPTSGGPGSELTIEYVARETAGLLHFWAIDQWG